MKCEEGIYILLNSSILLGAKVYTCTCSQDFLRAEPPHFICKGGAKGRLRHRQLMLNTAASPGLGFWSKNKQIGGKKKGKQKQKQKIRRNVLE